MFVSCGRTPPVAIVDLRGRERDPDGARPPRRHAWNRLPSGITLDLTREQFRAGETFTEPAVEEPLITRRNPERYERLQARVRAALG
jgi:hypothetical protein